MKKVLLINTNQEQFPYPVAPLGLCIIASTLKDKYQVKVLDFITKENPDIQEEIRNFNPHYIGFSIRNIDNLDIESSFCYIDPIYKKFLAPAREATDVPIILGGSGFSVFPEQIINKFEADYGIIGEGEKTFSALLNCLDNNQDPSSIPGVIKPGSFYNKNHHSFELSEFQKPEIDKKIDILPYLKRSAYPIQTKRGCSHKCIYCSYPILEGSQYRLREPDSIAEEIEETVKRYNCTSFEFVDSTFNDPAGHAEQICEEIIKRKLKINLRTMGINPANSSAGLFKLMMQAGFNQIDCTPDSASESVLINFKKNFSLSQLVKTAELIREHDIPTMWFFIFGSIGENEKTIQETYDFIDKYINRYDLVHMTMGLRIYPKTYLYDYTIKTGYINGETDLLVPRFFVSPHLGQKKLKEILKEKNITRPNCFLSNTTKPTDELLQNVLAYRKKNNVTEPMFRTLLKFSWQYAN